MHPLTALLKKPVVASLLVLWLLVAPGSAAAQSAHPATITLPSGNLPIEQEFPTPPNLGPNSQLVIEGEVRHRSNIELQVRIDDAGSHDYASRLNATTTLSAGRFRRTINLATARTTANKPLDLNALRRVILFLERDASAVRITRAAIVRDNKTIAGAGPPRSGDIARGRLPIVYDMGDSFALNRQDQITIEATNTGNTPLTMTLRIDDAKSTGYATRVNEEIIVPRGRFTRSIDVAAVLKSGPAPKAPIDLSAIRRLQLFASDDSRHLIIQRFALHGQATPLPPRQDITIPELTPPPRRREPIVLGTGPLPIPIEPSTPMQFNDQDELRIEGHNPDLRQTTLVVRIDDAQSSSYATRINVERQIPPGPFTFTLALKGQRTPNHRVIDISDVRRIIVFQTDPNKPITINNMIVRAQPELPDGAEAYALGRKDTEVPPGFEPIAPGDYRLHGGGARAIRRPRPDPVIANGIDGIDRLEFKTRPGRKSITLWTEDPGEWETLPHPLRRRITVNGKVALLVNQTPGKWIEHRYVRNQHEHGIKDDAWTAYGRHRGGAVTIDVDAPDGSVVVELERNGPGSQFLSAVLIEPRGSTRGFDFIQAFRADWYRSNFRVAPHAANPHAGPVYDVTNRRPNRPELKSQTTRGTGTRLTFQLSAATRIEKPRILVRPPEHAGVRLDTRIWAAKRRLELDNTLLRLADNTLVADTAALPVEPGTPRTYELWISSRANTPPGLYRGTIELQGLDVAAIIPLQIEVLPARLPPIAKPAGFYLAEPYQYAYFPALFKERDRQMKCDLDEMARLGITGTAPPAATIANDNYGKFVADMKRANAHGVTPGWLAYNVFHVNTIPARDRLNFAATIARVQASLTRQKVPLPVWSAADEPSNPEQAPADLQSLVEALRSKVPGIQLAGHLNSKGDTRYLPLFDVAIINDGYGIDRARIASVAKSGRRVWLYNTLPPRLTAGLWLWSTQAERYVQWHARMPTADPYDPLDGRESDFQMFLPTTSICPPVPDIHRLLLEMAEGVVDQRWLLWLNAQETTSARRLAARIKSDLGASWTRAQARAPTLAAGARAAIIQLARDGP